MTIIEGTWKLMELSMIENREDDKLFSKMRIVYHYIVFLILGVNILLNFLLVKDMSVMEKILLCPFMWLINLLQPYLTYKEMMIVMFLIYFLLYYPSLKIIIRFMKHELKTFKILKEIKKIPEYSIEARDRKVNKMIDIMEARQYSLLRPIYFALINILSGFFIYMLIYKVAILYDMERLFDIDTTTKPYFQIAMFYSMFVSLGFILGDMYSKTNKAGLVVLLFFLNFTICFGAFFNTAVCMFLTLGYIVSGSLFILKIITKEIRLKFNSKRLDKQWLKLGK